MSVRRGKLYQSAALDKTPHTRYFESFPLCIHDIDSVRPYLDLSIAKKEVHPNPIPNKYTVQDGIKRKALVHQQAL